ncbi:hypothetical protein [Glutamicibacter creatinolyticus]|uniref:hypothetical protein n=1 Tax=Glutamicibacter creatinolyticus TaxID=162496 RepID=UPI0031D1EC61
MSAWDWLSVIVVAWLGLCFLTTIGSARWLGYVAHKEQQLLERETTCVNDPQN